MSLYSILEQLGVSDDYIKLVTDRNLVESNIPESQIETFILPKEIELPEPIYVSDVFEPINTFVNYSGLSGTKLNQLGTKELFLKMPEYLYTLCNDGSIKSGSSEQVIVRYQKGKIPKPLTYIEVPEDSSELNHTVIRNRKVVDTKKYLIGDTTLSDFE
ncbi:MAG: hypothetical protein K0B02_03380 [DPANN group archaeon]|nr:hypothetical protein [DPANN group archaeon]